MRVLVVSTMFPSRVQPVHAVFVRNRIARVAERCQVRVVCPIPWFPLAGLLRRYAHRKEIPREDVIDGVQVSYPRFLSVPAVLKPLDGFFLFLCLWWTARRLARAFPFDLIDAHLAFPDGFACALLGRALAKPVTVTLRGHDVNDLPRYPVRRRQVAYALRRADRVIAVADALRRAALELGADPRTARTISNGVDADLFHPTDRREARRRLGLPLERKVVVSVGHLVERKGFHLIVEALAVIREAGREVPYLAIVGGPGEEGDFSGAIRDRVRRLGLEEDVLMAGPRRNEELRDWYNAADASCLASSKEGWANVLLESLACGTPAIATNVWGTPEVIASEELGILVERTVESIAAGIRRALEKPWDRDAIQAHARARTWHEVAGRVLEVFREVVPEAQGAASSDANRAARDPQRVP
ncbi:MAG: glycosyltransferase family 4 protein [Planctomycetes bacterium]|nr:glycosyltransferase family 4 protein [Planctomycetota bacterium]